MAAEEEEVGREMECPACNTVLQVPKPRKKVQSEPENRPKVWRFMVNNFEQGPLEESAIVALIKAGVVGASTNVWAEGMSDWTEASKTQLHSYFDGMPPGESNPQPGWYYAINDQQQGPIEKGVLIELIRNGTVTRSTRVWTKPMDAWVEADKTGLQKYFKESQSGGSADTTPRGTPTTSRILNRLESAAAKARASFKSQGITRNKKTAPASVPPNSVGQEQGGNNNPPKDATKQNKNTSSSQSTSSGAFAYFKQHPIKALALIIGIPLILLIIIGSCSTSTPSPNHTYSSTASLQEALVTTFQKTCNNSKQQIFDSIHPIGTAKNITVHEVTVDSWKNDQVGNKRSDIRQFTVIYTIYWEGPITKDGFTKVSEQWDNESQRSISQKILATNGITKNDIGYGIGFGLGVLGRTWLDNQMNGATIHGCDSHSDAHGLRRYSQ